MRFSIPISRVSGQNSFNTTMRSLTSSSSPRWRMNNANNPNKYLTVNLRTKSTLAGGGVGTGEGGEIPSNPAHYIPSNGSPIRMPPPPPPPEALSASSPQGPSSCSSSIHPSESDDQPPTPYDVHPLALDALLPTTNMHTQGHATDPYNEHPEDPQCQSVRKGMARRHFVDEASGAFEGDLLTYSTGSAYEPVRGAGGMGNGSGAQEYSVVPEFASATMSSAALTNEGERQKLREQERKLRSRKEEDLVYESAGADYYGYPDPDDSLPMGTGTRTLRPGVNPMDTEEYEGYMTRVYAATAGADAGAVVGDIEDPKDGAPTKEVDPQTREKDMKEWMERRKLALFYALDAARLSAEFPLHPPPSSSHSATSFLSYFSASSNMPEPKSETSTTNSILSDWIEPLDQRGGNPEGIGMLDQVGSASGTWRFYRLGGRQGEGFVPGWVEPAK